MRISPRTLLSMASCLFLFLGLSAQQANADLVHQWNVEGDIAGVLTDSVGGVDLTYVDPDEGSLSALAAAPGTGSSQGFTTVTGGEATSANPDDLFMASSFSLALWTQRLEATGSAQPMLLGVIENGNGFNHNYLLRSPPDGSSLAFFSRDEFGTTINLASSANLADLGWHHVAATFDWSGVPGTPATAKIYVDGVETGSTTESTWNGWDPAVQTQGGIGQTGFTPVANFDDLRIYDNVLTAQEIADLAVTSATNELGLEVNTTTGEVTLVNATGAPVDIDYYEIRSAPGDLDPGKAPGDYNGNGITDAADFTVWRDNLNGPGPDGDGTGSDLLGIPNGIVDQFDFDYWVANFGATGDGWNSLQDQDLPGFPSGDGTGNGWEEGLNVDETVLLETYLLASSAVPVDAAISLGNAFNVGGTEELTFEYHRAGAGPNDFVTGTVNFVSSAAVPEPSALGIAFVLLFSIGIATRRRG